MVESVRERRDAVAIEVAGKKSNVWPQFWMMCRLIVDYLGSKPCEQVTWQEFRDGSYTGRGIINSYDFNADMMGEWLTISLCLDVCACVECDGRVIVSLVALFFLSLLLCFALYIYLFTVNYGSWSGFGVHAGNFWAMSRYMRNLSVLDFRSFDISVCMLVYVCVAHVFYFQPTLLVALAWKHWLTTSFTIPTSVRLHSKVIVFSLSLPPNSLAYLTLPSHAVLQTLVARIP